MSVRGIFACSSISATSGRTCACANSRTLSRSRRSSSVSVVSEGSDVSVGRVVTVRMLSLGPEPRVFPARSLIRSIALLLAASSAPVLIQARQQTPPAQQQPPPTPPPQQQEQQQPTFRLRVDSVSV